jgi:hypothetical protein
MRQLEQMPGLGHRGEHPPNRAKGTTTPKLYEPLVESEPIGLSYAEFLPRTHPNVL